MFSAPPAQAQPVAPALESAKPAAKSLLARFKPAKTAAPATAVQTESASHNGGPNGRVVFLGGLLAGMAVMFLGTRFLGSGGAPEPAQLAPQPYASVTTTETEIVGEGETFVDEALGSSDAAN